MKNLKRDMALLMRGYKIIFSIDKSLIPLNIIRSLMDAILPFILIYGSAEIINALSRGDEAKKIFIILIITVISSSAAHIITEVVWRTLNVKDKYFEQQFNMYLNAKILNMDYGNIENPETHLKRQRIAEIRNMGGGGIWKLVYQIRNVISGLFTIILSVAITYRAFTTVQSDFQGGFAFIFTSSISAVVLCVLLLAIILLSIHSNALNTKKSHKAWDEAIPFNRIFNYILSNYMASYHAGKDIRLYNQKHMIMDSFKRLIKNTEPTLIKMERCQRQHGNITVVLTSALEWLVYIFVGVKALYKLIGLGDLFKYINGIMRFGEGLKQFLNSFNELRTNNAYLEILYEFLDIPSKMYHGTLSVEKRNDNEYEIEFKNVSFKYPGSENYALKNFNLKFNIGQRMAVVGMNGSGKTTMIKLLCRLYDPTEGEILLNGFDIKKYKYDEYMGIFSVVFQNFKLFSFSLGQNVAAAVDYANAQAEKYIEMAGLKERFSEMPKGMETPLYKDFEEDGVEISGGEAQKIALARALYKNAPFIVLDEPTAALDPIAEFEIYSKFNEIVGDKTAIYISHRLSSCRFCDDIAVFHEGELIQRGNHDTLLENESGKYYELWNAQAQYYQENRDKKDGVT